jgi:glycosyltransferase involved in cell wall biosynthesis
MKLLLTGIDPLDEIDTWSGIPFHLCQSLRKKFELCFVGGLDGPSASRHKFREMLHRRLRLGSYRLRSEPGVLKEFARRLRDRIKREKPDAVLSMNCEPIAYLKTELPIFLIHDATFRLLLEGYPHFKALCKRSQHTGETAQILGFARATAILAASEWARQSASRDYGVPAAKMNVIPLGANLLDPPGAEEILAAIGERPRSKEVNFLFVGVEWERKGGDSAVAIVEELVRRGVAARLHLVGCVPRAGVTEKPFVTVHGFLSKNNPAQAIKLRELFITASYFIMPSVADCSPCVLAEASAFGVPSVSRKVGGIPEIVKSEKTGLLISDALPESRVVDLLVELFESPPRYREMAQAARADFEARLNWDAYTARLEEIIRSAPPLPETPAPRLQKATAS